MARAEGMQCEAQDAKFSQLNERIATTQCARQCRQKWDIFDFCIPKCEVIEEGVEIVAHGSMLLQLGCELAQGFGIARPMPATHLPAWVASWQPDAAWAQLA